AAAKSHPEGCLWEYRGAASLRTSCGGGKYGQINVEASARARVADHASAFNPNPAQDRVAVTIGGGGDDPQAIARGLTLGPQLITRAAEERYIAVLQGHVECRPVHEAEHEHLAGRGVLHDGRHQASHLIEVDFHRHNAFPFAQNK